MSFLDVLLTVFKNWKLAAVRLEQIKYFLEMKEFETLPVNFPILVSLSALYKSYLCFQFRMPVTDALILNSFGIGVEYIDLTLKTLLVSTNLH